MGHRHRYQLGEPGHDLDRFQGCVRTIPERTSRGRERGWAEEMIGSMGGRVESDERRSRAETDGDESETTRETIFEAFGGQGKKRQDDGRARIVPRQRSAIRRERDCGSIVVSFLAPRGSSCPLAARARRLSLDSSSARAPCLVSSPSSSPQSSLAVRPLPTTKKERNL